MLETPHAVVGAAIAVSVTNPFLAVPLAFLSHFVLDMTPHWNPHISTEIKKHGSISKTSKNVIYGDLFVAGAVSLGIASQFSDRPVLALTILASAFAGMLPDIIEAPYFFFHYKNEFLTHWMAFQKAIQNDTDIYWGIATQVITVIGAFWWMFT